MFECLTKINWKKVGLFASGTLFGTAGIKALASDDAKKLYTNCTAAVLRAKETVMNTAVVDHTNARIMQLQTTHISELDQKIETLNGRIGNYLSRVATQQFGLYGSLLILLLVAGLLLVVYKALRSKNRLNKELSA